MDEHNVTSPSTRARHCEQYKLMPSYRFVNCAGISDSGFDQLECYRRQQGNNGSTFGKVEGILGHLNTLPAESDEDLVLVIDGYDIVFQLRPDVLIGRYYDLVEQSNKRLLERFGARKMYKNNIYQSVVFGPDKACWPQSADRAACWAVPESTLPRWISGPDTDTEEYTNHNRARWLNSGTIMGPVKDVRAVVQAAVNMIRAEHRKLPWFTSDQYWFAEVWAKQEYNRILIDEGRLQSNKRMLWHRKDMKGRGGRRMLTKLSFPTLGKRKNVDELHITLDYESLMFQTMSFTYDYFAWQQYDDSDIGLLGPQRVLDEAPYTLADDILRSPAPFSGFEKAGEDFRLETNAPLNATWRSLALGTNTATHNVFPLLHYTGPKLYREAWWSRLWYQPYIEDLLKMSSSLAREKYGTTVDGREWWPYVSRSEGTQSGNGAFGDDGVFLPWSDICEEDGKSVVDIKLST